ncbi:YraN family protein [Patescibacteria group bacterium]
MSKKIGNLGEQIALEFLRKRGYKFVAQNFRYHRYGEIDLIVEKDRLLHFVEVKTRTNQNFGSGADAVDDYKLNKIFSAIEVFLLKHRQFDLFYWQVDVIEIELDFPNHRARINFLKDFS